MIADFYFLIELAGCLENTGAADYHNSEIETTQSPHVGTV